MEGLITVAALAFGSVLVAFSFRSRMPGANPQDDRFAAGVGLACALLCLFVLRPRPFWLTLGVGMAADLAAAFAALWLIRFWRNADR